MVSPLDARWGWELKKTVVNGSRATLLDDAVEQADDARSHILVGLENGLDIFFNFFKILVVVGYTVRLF